MSKTLRQSPSRKTGVEKKAETAGLATIERQHKRCCSCGKDSRGHKRYSYMEKRYEMICPSCLENF
jgi:hypothetical protein